MCGHYAHSAILYGLYSLNRVHAGLILLQVGVESLTKKKWLLLFFSLIKGSSVKDGRLPVLVNFVWPTIVGAVYILVMYFTQRQCYVGNGVQ